MYVCVVELQQVHALLMHVCVYVCVCVCVKLAMSVRRHTKVLADGEG